MTFSQFTAHFEASRRRIPASVAAEIRRAGIDRVTERLRAGIADEPLDFRDLISRIEDAVMGRAA